MILPALLLIGGAAAILAVVLTARSPEPAPPIVLEGPPVGPSGIALSENEIEALGRIISSEAGDGSLAEQRAVGWTARNRFRGKSIYATQYPWREQKGSDPPFSSARGATNATKQLAREILAADQSQDPTGGATSFFEPRMQDIFFKAGELARAGETGSRVIDGVKLTDITRFKNYKKDAATIRQNWSNGSTVYATAGRFEFWGSKPLFAKRGGQVQTIAGFVDGRTADDTEALARALESELGGRPPDELHAAAWAIRNRADEEGTSVHNTLAPKGEYGAPKKSGGYCSTRRAPTERSFEIACVVLDASTDEDPTGGAVDFWVPTQQEAMRAFGDVYRAAAKNGDQDKAKRYARYADYGTEEQVREQHARNGLKAVHAVGVVELLGRG